MCCVFFPEWHNTFKLSHSFCVQIVNRGVVIWINFDLVLVRQSKQMHFFTWEMYNPGLTRNMGEIIFSFRIFTPAGLLNIIKVCRDTPS